MKRCGFAAACSVLLLASGAQAQFIADGVETETSAGAISIVDSNDGFSREVHVGDQRFFTDGFYRHVSIEAQLGALYLIGLGAGGNACGVVYVWLNTSDRAAVLSEQFGNCAPLSDILSDSQTVSVVVTARDPADGRTAFVYDGRQISEVVLGQMSAGIGMNPVDWIGRSPYEMFADADWRPDLVALMGEENYRRIGRTVALSIGFEQVGNWVVGVGRNPRVAGDDRAVVAMHIATGQVIVAARSGINSMQIWGDKGQGLPRSILDAIEF